jgi:hypothetical protein
VRTKKGAPSNPLIGVIGGAPQAEALARHVAPRQIGEATVIDAHMAISVEQAHALAVDPSHPFPSQAALPLGCLTVLTAELRDFSAQSFDFRHPVQAQQFAPLPGGEVAALLQRTAAHQRQKCQGQKDRLHWVEPWSQPVKAARVAQKPFGQKSRQRAKHPTVRHIISGDKLQFRTGQKPAGGHHSLQRPCRAVTHLGLAIGQRTLAERARFTGTLFIAQQPYDALRPFDRDPRLTDALSSRPSAF